MSGSTFPRAHVWADDEDLYASTLNAEFDNILNNLNPAGIDGYEDSTAQMKLQTSPGGFGTESLATSLAGEIERIRFVISRMIGGPDNLWYDTPALSLAGVSTLFSAGQSTPQNRVASGRLSTTGQAMALQASGSTNAVTLKATATNLSYYVANTNYTATTDSTLSSLTLAPGTNNTAAVNDGSMAAQAWTKLQGEYDATLVMGSAGTAISNLVGQYAAFKITHSAANEYFIAYVAASNQLTKVRRGYFFDSTDALIPRIGIADTDVITLMKLTWLFVNTSGALAATYNQPKYSKASPASPATGDYWFDLANNIWNIYNGAAFVAANATLIGTCIQDGTKTVASRTFEYYASFNTTQTVMLDFVSNTLVQASTIGQKVSVMGNLISFGTNQAQFASTGQFASGASLSANTPYYFYVTYQGDLFIDIVPPYDRRTDLQGYYHPANPWRCVGYMITDGSSHFTQPLGYGINDVPEGAIAEAMNLWSENTPRNWLPADGSAVSRLAYFPLYTQIKQACGEGDNSTTFNLPDMNGRFYRVRDHGFVRDPDASSRTEMATGGAVGDLAGSVQTDAFKAHNHTITAGTSGSTSNVPQQSSGTTTGVVSTGNTGGLETRPINAYVNAFIKP